MSATAWSACPRCHVKAVAEHEAKKKAAEAAYGKVSPEEYELLSKQAAVPLDENENLREDYEMWITDSGIFKTHYHAKCSECDFEFDFKHEEVAEVQS